MTSHRLLAAAAGLALAAVSSQALAHAHLLKADPAAGATVAPLGQISLKFSEKLEAAFSGFDLTHGGEKLPVKAGLAKDGVTLTGALAKPLSAGAYHLMWHVVSADGHRMTGAYDFAVK